MNNSNILNVTSEEIYRLRKQFFNDAAERWIDMWYRNRETGDYDRHARDFERLFSLLSLRRGETVLDAGCGTGVLVPFLLERIGGEGILYELDFAEEMIAVNRRLHSEGNIRFIVSDLENAPLQDASCDVAICFSCFPHFQDKAQALTTVERILKRGGSLVISHFDSSEGINQHHSSCDAVMHDHLPNEVVMRALFRQTRMSVEVFYDEPGFYFIRGRKP
jgi:demethylmenaquinone methyltransferase/2-methoxy-6-polyprenyl-1,4-benzoquinol methylase